MTPVELLATWVLLVANLAATYIGTTLIQRALNPKPPKRAKQLMTDWDVLPEHVKDYITAIETNADPAGTVREAYWLRQENEYLIQQRDRLRSDRKRLRVMNRDLRQAGEALLVTLKRIAQVSRPNTGYYVPATNVNFIATAAIEKYREATK